MSLDDENNSDGARESGCKWNRHALLLVPLTNRVGIAEMLEFGESKTTVGSVFCLNA